MRLTNKDVHFVEKSSLVNQLTSAVLPMAGESAAEAAAAESETLTRNESSAEESAAPAVGRRTLIAGFFD